MANEKRLIDANALLEDFGEEPMVWNDGEAEIQERSDWHRYRVIVKLQPTVDAVEVVRCKDCVYWNRAMANKRGFLICKASGMEIMANDFCSYGERRTDNERKAD